MTKLLRSGKITRKNVFVPGIIFLFFVGNFSGKAQCSTVDQSQLNYNGGMSARNLAQYTVWQDFTAGVTGTLCQLDVGFFNPMTGTGTLNIFAGTGTGGTSLQTQTVTVSGTGNFFQSFTTSVSVTSGSVYTFQFVPTQGGGLPDPYGVQVENPGTYTGGQMEITDPSGTSATGFDMVFKTYVSGTTGIFSGNSTNSLSIYPNPATSEVSVNMGVDFTNKSLVVYNSFGQEVKRIDNVGAQEVKLHTNVLVHGLYLVAIVQGGVTISEKKLLIAN